MAEIGRFKVSGVLAWLLWLFVHIFFLIGFRNRVMVMLEWAWSYLTYQRSARIILESPVDVLTPDLVAHDTHTPAQSEPAASLGDGETLTTGMGGHVMAGTGNDGRAKKNP